MRVYYEKHFLFWVDPKGKVHPPKGRHGSSSSRRCDDCELRGALTSMGLPQFCSECRSGRKKGKNRCTRSFCANGCEVCGGTGRVGR